MTGTVAREMADAPTRAKPRMRFEVYQDVKKGWRWSLIAANGEIIADSGEAYVSYSNALRSIARIRGLIWEAPVTRVQDEEVPE